MDFNLHKHDFLASAKKMFSNNVRIQLFVQFLYFLPYLFYRKSVLLFMVKANFIMKTQLNPHLLLIFVPTI